MSQPISTIQVGHKVPDFKLATYEPSKKDFGQFDLAQVRESGRWTVLVFYPADFTFV